MHRELIAEFGGAQGVLNEHALESALAAPRNQQASESPSILE